MTGMHEWSLNYLTLTDEELQERLNLTCDCTNCLMHRNVARAEISRRTLIWAPPLPGHNFSAADVIGEDERS